MPPSSRPNDNDPKAMKITARPPIGPPTKAGDKAAPGAEVPGGVAASPLIPGEETTWEKYSPNGEPFISGMASGLLHFAVPGLLIAMMILLGVGSAPPAAEEFETVEIGNGEPGGGGGNREGVEVGNPANLTRPQDDVKTLDQAKTPVKATPEDDPEIKARKGPTIDDEQLAMSFVEKIKSKPATANLGPVLKEAMEGLAGKGQGGDGRGGGLGKGVGKGIGDGVGDGTGRTNRRGRRNLRWELHFGVSEARQYLQQTDACGMILSIPDRTGKLMLIRDIKARPALPQYEDVKAMNRNWFTDDRAQSAESVANELQLDIVPPVLLFFYPIEFENALLKKELEWRGRKEEDIAYTKFSITFSGGKPVIKVMAQDPLPGRK